MLLVFSMLWVDLLLPTLVSFCREINIYLKYERNLKSELQHNQ